MITYFDSFYGGHVEVDNVGLKGASVDDRWLSNEHLATVFQEARGIAQVMDRMGFDTLWLAEHHFQREGYGSIPNILMLAVYLSQVTERLNFGGFFNTVPAWHPLRLAEDFAKRGGGQVFVADDDQLAAAEIVEGSTDQVVASLLGKIKELGLL